MSAEVVEAARRFFAALDNERAFSRDWHEHIGSDGKQRGDDRTTTWLDSINDVARAEAALRAAVEAAQD